MTEMTKVWVRMGVHTDSVVIAVLQEENSILRWSSGFLRSCAKSDGGWIDWPRSMRCMSAAKRTAPATCWRECS